MKVDNSERLSYRLLGNKDEKLFFALDSDPEVMRYINGGVPHSMDDIIKLALPRLAAYTNPEKGYGMWGVFTKKCEFIGWILLRPMNFFSDSPEFDNLEIGWRFMKDSWGNGYATEAAMQIKRAAIEQGGIRAISAIAVQDNKGSINIMEKIGLEYVKQYCHHDDQLGDLDAVYYQEVL